MLEFFLITHIEMYKKSYIQLSKLKYKININNCMYFKLQNNKIH